jgi:phage terminase Nu1 subunit (DNA packaging protein)
MGEAARIRHRVKYSELVPIHDCNFLKSVIPTDAIAEICDSVPARLKIFREFPLGRSQIVTLYWDMMMQS